MYSCTCESLIISLILLFGLSFLLPGILLRLQHSNNPTPFVYLNSCISNNKYIATNKVCGTENTEAIQYIKLNYIYLTKGVSYVPVIYRDNKISTGSVSIDILDSNSNKIVGFTNNITPNQNTDGLIDLPNYYKTNDAVQIYRSSSIYPLQNTACDDSQLGCKYVLINNLSKLFISNSPFNIPSTTTLSNPFSQYHSNVTIRVNSINIVRTDDASTPELYLGFEQLNLSTLQFRGVIYIITGVIIILIGIALISFYGCFIKREDSEDEHED